MSMRVLSGYYELTKPGIALFIGTSAAAGFITATGGWSLSARLATALLATMLMSGGAAALNHLAERGGDARMRLLFAWRFVRQPERIPARQLFFSSLLVLPLVLGALMADLLLPI